MNLQEITIDLKRSVYVPPNATYALYNVSAYNAQKLLLLISDEEQTEMELLNSNENTEKLFDQICALALSPQHLFDVLEDTRHREIKIFE